jgi:shikimate 5-dehydrogenase
LAGCTVIPGYELFINQAARQFELWTGQSAPINTLREVLLRKLATGGG